MTEYEVHEIIKGQVCKEIEIIAEKIKKTGTMTEIDLEKLDKLYHTKKDLLATHGMENPEEYEGFSGEGDMSGRRGRSSVTGRFVSRDGGQSYAEGYSQGYSEAMNQQSGNRNYSNGYSQGYSEAMKQSGHYPMYPDMRYRY